MVQRPVGAREDLLPGAVVGAYVIRGTLGHGGCATVYLAEDTPRGRRAALKVLLRGLAASPKMVERFLREVHAIQRVLHPGIVEVFDVGLLSDGRPYYAMELQDGVTLDALLKERGRLSPAEVLEIMEPLCTALAAVHQAGIVHRDLKASNVFLAGTGGRPIVKILDFGIAKLVRPDDAPEGFTTRGRQLGTPSAMAPEQIECRAVDDRTDVYGLGVLLFKMLTGRLPFHGTTMLEMEIGHLHTRPTRPSLVAPVDPAIDAVVLRCLEKLPEKRYASVTALLDDLRRAARAEATPRSPDDAPAGGDDTPRAVAVHVEVRVPHGAELEPSDEVLDQVGALLDTAERELLAARFELPVTAGCSVLAVLLLPPGAAEATRERRRAIEVARALHEQLAARAAEGEGVQVRMCVHEDAARTGPGPHGRRIAGGPILRLAAWVPAGGDGAFATREIWARLHGGAEGGCADRYQSLSGRGM